MAENDDPIWDYIEKHPFKSRWKPNNVGDPADIAADKSTPAQRKRIIEESVTVDIDLKRGSGEMTGDFAPSKRPKPGHNYIKSRAKDERQV